MDKEVSELKIGNIRELLERASSMTAEYMGEICAEAPKGVEFACAFLEVLQDTTDEKMKKLLMVKDSVPDKRLQHIFDAWEHINTAFYELSDLVPNGEKRRPGDFVRKG